MRQILQCYHLLLIKEYSSYYSCFTINDITNLSLRFCIVIYPVLPFFPLFVIQTYSDNWLYQES